MKSITSRSAFSLIELIVSLAITSVIALFVFGFASSLAKMWQSTESGVGTELDVQIALDAIAKDIESAIFKESDAPMFAVSAISKTEEEVYEYNFSNRWVDVSPSGTDRPSDQHFDPSIHRYGWAGSWLRFFTAAPSFNAVGYQIIRRPAFSDSEIPRYLLHRGVVRHDHTLAAGNDITASTYGGTTTSEVSAGVVKSPRVSSVILEDVIDFGVRLYVFDPGFVGNEDAPEGMRLIFPAESDGDLSDEDFEHLAKRKFVDDDEENDFTDVYPDVIEVFVRVLDDVGADLLLDSQEGFGELTFEDIEEMHSRVYRRMIRRPGKGAQG